MMPPETLNSRGGGVGRAPYRRVEVRQTGTWGTPHNAVSAQPEREIDMRWADQPGCSQAGSRLTVEASRIVCSESRGSSPTSP